MFFLAKQLFSQRLISWAMILLLAISPIQVAMAADINLDGHGEHCQMALMQVDGSSMNMDCALDHGSKCSDHLGCVNISSSATAQKSKLSIFQNQKVVRLSLHLFDAAISTHYPELLKRPPKV